MTPEELEEPTPPPIEPPTASEEPEDSENEEPEAKLRSEEAKRYRLRAKTAEQERDTFKAEAETHRKEAATVRAELDSLKALADPAATEALRKELAFYREAYNQKLRDPEAVFRLLDPALISVEEGEVKGIDRAVAHALNRYPFLAGEDTEQLGKTQPEITSPSGAPFNSPRQDRDGVDLESLADRFPSLKRALRR